MLENKKPADENKIERVNWKLKNNQNLRGLQYDWRKEKGGKTKDEILTEKQGF